MALFGNLRDIPLADLLAMLVGRQGVLEVFGLPGLKPCQIAVRGGRILWVKQGGKLLEPLQARALLVELVARKEGAFEFHPGLPRPEGPLLGWSLERALLDITTYQDERQAYRDQLPHPETRFRVGRELRLEEEPLKGFWQQARPFLQQEASARDLARVLCLPLEEVRFYLHKLRLLGAVVPVRTFAETQLGVSGPEKGLIARLLRALRGRGA